MIDSFEPAWRKIGDFSETLDKVDIGCGDSSIVHVNKGIWRDKKRNYADASPPGGDAKGVTPCDLVSALTYDTNAYNNGNTVMLCDKRADSPLRQQDTFSQVNKGNIHKKPIDLVSSAGSLSATLIHEFMHVSDIKKCKTWITSTDLDLAYLDIISAVPGIIDNQPEVYKYDGCHGLRTSDARWHNADTFAILARGMFISFNF